MKPKSPLAPSDSLPEESRENNALPTVDAAPPTAGPSAGTVDDRSAAVSAMGTVDYQAPDPRETLDHPKDTHPDVKSAKKGMPAAIAGYDILGVLGSGAMGVVYKASQRGLKRTVALKMILTGGLASESEVARFRSEAEAVAQLHHANIVQIYEVGDAKGMPYFSLEFVEGSSLDKKIRDNPMSSQDAARVCHLLAGAMEYAHQRGVIHRDLKPSNVLLSADGVPKIGDFGLAKRLNTEDSGVTCAGTILGTPSFMAPEQAEGKLDELGPRSDVYSLGAILYDVLTGRAPFRGTTVLETLEQVRTREPVPPVQLQPTVSRDLETICLKCLQKDPAKRYQTAGQLEADLGRFLRGEPILARPISRVERTWRWCQRNPRTAALSTTIAAVVIAWAVTSSILAVALKQQKDEADKQTGIAKAEKVEADKQTEEAIKQTGIANEKTQIANEKTQIAIRTEKSAKKTAEVAIQDMATMGKMLYERLQARRLDVLANPEERKLREDVINMLRQAMLDIGKKVDTAGFDTFGEAGVCQAMGNVLVEIGQSEEGLKMHERAAASVQRFLDRQPTSDLARGNLGVMNLSFGHIALKFQGDAKSARDYYRKARDLHEDVLKNPHTHTYKEHEIKRLISHDDHNLGNAYLALGDPAEALKYFRESETLRQLWADTEKKSLEARSYVMEAQMSEGMAASYLADDKAFQHLLDALATGDALIKDRQKYIPYQGDRAEALSALGDALFRTGKMDDAFKNYDDSLKIMRMVVEQRPNLTEQLRLVQAHERLAGAYAQRKNKAEAEKLYKEALKQRMELYQIEPKNLSRQAALVLAMARAGDIRQATLNATNIGPRMTQSTELQLQLARTWAVCASKDAEQRSKHLDKAVELLQAATKEDYKNVVLLETDPDLATLRDQPAFVKIVEQVKSRK